MIVKNLTKKFNDFTALNDINLSIDDPFTIIMGKSGSGKSTLLNCMSSIITDYDGEIIVEDIVLNSLSANQKSDFRKNYVSFIFQ